MPYRYKRNPESPGSLRKRAEIAWRTQRAELGDGPAGKDAAGLLHELEVHQIELELQNEELRRTRNEVEEAHDELLELYDFAPVGYITLDRNTVILKANLKAASLLGVERSLLKGQNFRHYCAVRAEADSFWLSLSQGHERSHELRLGREVGYVDFPALVETVGPIQSEKGPIWRCTITDISIRKQAEDAIRWQAELMRLSHDAIIVWRLTGEIVSWNQGAEDLYRFTEKGAVGRRLEELLQTVRCGSWSEIEDVLADRGGWQGELQRRTSDGRELTVSARLQVVQGADGTTLVFEVDRDITGQKLVEREREREASRKDEFLAMLGHELRNPLAAIFTAMQILSGDVTAEQRQALMNVASQQVTLMRRLLDELLDLGRLAHGHLELIKESIDLAEYLHVVTAAARPAIAERGQSLVLRLPNEPVLFWADKVRLEQIAGNLLNNASKYTQRGGVIEFSGAREASEIVIKVRDNGRGIPPETLTKIFQPFARGEATVEDYGQASLGIGLALARELTLLHGGTVVAESAGSGTGSEFTVRLPLVEAPVIATDSVEEHPPAEDKRTIVIVEDNPNTNLVMKMALELAGHQVTIFADGPTALAGVAHLKPDALLLDIGLPGIDGYELLARMRELPHLRETLFIGISGFKKRSGQSRTARFDYYLPKPADLNEILAILADHPRPRANKTAEG